MHGRGPHNAGEQRPADDEQVSVVGSLLLVRGLRAVFLGLLNQLVPGVTDMAHSREITR